VFSHSIPGWFLLVSALSDGVFVVLASTATHVVVVAVIPAGGHHTLLPNRHFSRFPYLLAT
jgi:hypothetical protein